MSSEKALRLPSTAGTQTNNLTILMHFSKKKESLKKNKTIHSHDDVVAEETKKVKSVDEIPIQKCFLV